MFPLHETTQRRVCRVTFLLVGVLPTLLTLGWIAYMHRPWRQADWQRTLAQQLHVRATLDQIATPRPGVTTLTNLHFADLRTDKPLGEMPQLTLQRQHSRLTLHADHLELQAEQLPAFVTAVATWLATNELAPIDFHADQFTITNLSHQSIQLKNLRVSSDLSNPAIQSFRIEAKVDGDQKKAIHLVLEHQDGTLRTKLDTQQTPLPAWLIGKLVPGISSCAEAKFSGVLTATSSEQQTRGDLRGQLDNVNLQQWTGTAGPHRLQCLAQVQLKQLTWSDATVELAQGEIEAGSSLASYSLFLALADQKLFHCGVGSGWKNHQPTSAEQLIAFEQLALGFEMSSAGITLTGMCEDGALMIAEDGPLLFSPQKNTVLPVANLVQLFHRRQKSWLPDTRGAHEMASGLPLPGEKKSEFETHRK